MSARRDAYEKVYDGDLEDYAGSDDSLVTHNSSVVGRPQRNINVVSHAFAIIIGFVACFVALQWRDDRYHKTCTAFKLSRSSLAPAELTRYSKTVRYNGTLDYPSIYRGNWTEVNDAWIDITEIGFMDLDVTEDDIKELGADPETLARFPEKDGGGYVMTIEYTHQLHCLDLLRRVNPWNYPEYMKHQKEFLRGWEGKHTEQMFRTHVDHCTEMLRQILMCHADTTPVFEQWVSVRGHPWPNFNTVHQCRDFEAIHKWSKKHVKSSNIGWPTRPEHAKALLIPP